MATRRKRTTTAREDLSKPSKWRLQHGRLGASEHATDPDTGAKVQQRRTVDTLGMLLSNGAISDEMHDAAAKFRAQFRAAALDGMRTMPLVRMPPGTSMTLTERHVGARQHVADAIDAVGGMASPGGSCLWHVVGLECSIREWSMHHGWNGTPVLPAHGQGILVSALGALVMHYDRVPTARRTGSPRLLVVPPPQTPTQAAPG
jgi:hypothetical protein